MALSYFKLEPEFNNVGENSRNTSGVYRQALDLSTKNTGNDENGENLVEIKPEFVNIKSEVDYETASSIKEEPRSDDEYNQPSNWESGAVATRTEPIDYTNWSNCEVTVKQEIIEVGESTLNYGSRKPNIKEEYIDEDELNLNSVEKGKYMCPFCHRRFASKSNILKHQLLHKNKGKSKKLIKDKKQLNCNICFRAFVKAGPLKKHVQSHAVEKQYDCTDCGKKFRTPWNLDQHARIHLAVKPFHCKICQKQFAVKANLLKHEGKRRCKIASNEPIVCNVCNKVFTREFLLRSHLRRHSTEKPYTCAICEVSFKYKSTLARHIQLHNGIKPYSCKICKKQFTHAGLIKPHMRKHTGEKPYQCPICSKMFAHKHNMERHTQRHAKIKHLVCDICDKRFPKESRLVYHMRTHTNEKPFACNVCPKKFTHRQNVIRHYDRKHPGEVFDSPVTDASVAREVWETVVFQRHLKKEPESNDEYVIP